MSLDDAAILWQNKDRTVALIDIPRSIAAAQGTKELPCQDVLMSSKALEHPYPSHEPKSEHKKTKLQNNTIDEELHASYTKILREALAEVSGHHTGDWCLPRPFLVSHGNVAAKKRKRNTGIESVTDAIEVEQAIEQTSKDAPDSRVVGGRHGTFSVDAQARANGICMECCGDDASFLSNCQAEPVTISFVSTPGQMSHKIRMPPFSSVYQGDCADSRPVHNAIRAQAQAHDTQKHFDFILLDPPWPNRSVRRAQHRSGASYGAAISLRSIQQLILGTDLDMLMADSCLVGMWITNKQAIRDLVLGPGGVFDTWGLELQEEWIWLKTTAAGEPITALDSVWRKPYEVFLLGRKRSQNAEVSEPEQVHTTRRVITSVPDLHSRKPCLKALVEPMLPGHYRGLEVFARHLVRGWISWGNEASKFNSINHWMSVSQ